MQKIDVAMAITRHADTGKFLMLKKGAWYRQHRERYAADPWEVPGGKLHDDDDDLAAAAQRELQEEAGLDGAVVARADPYSVVQHDEHGEKMRVTFHPFLLDVHADPDSVTLQDTIQNGEPEHETYDWVAAEQVSAYLTQHEREAFTGLIEGFPWD